MLQINCATAHRVLFVEPAQSDAEKISVKVNDKHRVSFCTKFLAALIPEILARVPSVRAAARLAVDLGGSLT